MLRVADFETKAIDGNTTARPPKPVGLAYKFPGKKGVYLGWGHHDSKNRDRNYAKACEILNSGIDKKDQFLFHNAKFDCSVAEHHMGVKFSSVPATNVHDTLFSIFLHDPYAASFSLKPSAERILGLAPEEQTDLRNWILAHVPQATEKDWGAYIAETPESIVAPYAIGDVDRTLLLHEKLYPLIPRAAYEREQKLRPILMESERRGIRCDTERLQRDMSGLEKSLLACDDLIFAEIGQCDIGSPTELANALEVAGKIGTWILTPTGKRSTARDNLEKAIADKKTLHLLQYRNALSHLLSNFGRPWIQLASQYNGRLHPEWNQVRQMRDGTDKTKGARTGRLSGSKPNFQNMPNEYEIVIPEGLPPLPLMRQYMLPDKGMVWLKRDYSQQELRILAHFSEGRLFQRYQEDPTIDAHVETSALITEHAGIELPRKYVKITGFSVIYGSGIQNLADQMGVQYGEAQQVRNAYFKAMPEVRQLMNSCSTRGKSGGTIMTWGGREYPVEPSRIVKGRYMDYSYKLLNYLIQGSAGDCTKESIIRWGENRGDGQFLDTVHDQNDIQAPKESWKQDMVKLKEAMESIEFDVKMLSDGFYSRKNWAELKECE